MKITELIAQHITEVHEGGNWTEVNIKDTLADVGYKEATTVTRASYNTIAALVHHLSFYNDVVMQRLSGNDPVISESNGFDMAAIKNEDDWIKLKERNIQSAQQLASAVREFPEEKIFELDSNRPCNTLQNAAWYCRTCALSFGTNSFIKETHQADKASACKK